MPVIGNVDIKYSCDSQQGGRKYMEDIIHIKFEKVNDQLQYAFFAVYDGHGGPNASSFARDHLHDEITKHRGFWSRDDTQVLKAIKEGFISCHRLMWKAVGSWPKTVSGLPSTSGSTASVVFIKNGKVYCAHVGDSGVVLGVKSKNGPRLGAHCITVDHKPESPKELKRIRACGGNVVAKSGVNRVVWDRPKQHNGPLLRSTEVDHIPFLAVARALGDLWSYNSNNDVFVVSPEPDVCVFELDVSRHSCLVLASDGLWNMIRPQDCIDIVQRIELDKETTGDSTSPTNSAKALVRCALDRWMGRNLRADNTSVVVIMLNNLNVQQRERSPSTASTISLMSSQSEEEVSESDISDSDLIDSFAPDIDMDGEEDEEGSSDSNNLLNYGGVGLMRTPPCDLTYNSCKPRLRRLSSLKRAQSKSGSLTKKPMFSSHNFIVGSAPAKLGHRNQMRGVIKSSPFARSRAMNRGPQQSGSNASFMDPGFKTPSSLIKSSEGSARNIGASPVLHSGERTLRPKSPRLMGENMQSASCLPGTSTINAETSDKERIKVTENVVNGRAFTEPMEGATSPQSHIKVIHKKGSSPSTGLVSPIWPTGLGSAASNCNISESSGAADDEGTENIEHLKITPKKYAKRRPGSYESTFSVKRPRSASFSAQLRNSSVRTRGQLKSLSPCKNKSQLKSVIHRKTKS